MKLQEKIQGVIDFQKGYEKTEDDFNWLEFAQDYAEHYHTQQLAIDGVSESTLTIPDIRNKLSPVTHLISMVERGEKDFANKAIPQAKESVNYLAQRKVYSR